jgi:hypothetical protein
MKGREATNESVQTRTKSLDAQLPTPKETADSCGRNAMPQQDDDPTQRISESSWERRKEES